MGSGLLLIFNQPVLAHPGRTDVSGCHTCRTNCASWGLADGEYHCHNGGGGSGSAPGAVSESVIQPTSVPAPKPTSAPTPKPIPTPTSAPKIEDLLGEAEAKVIILETELARKKR